MPLQGGPDGGNAAHVTLCLFFASFAYLTVMKIKKFLKRFFLTIGILIVLFAGYFFLIRMLDNKAAQSDDFGVTAYNQTQAMMLPSLFMDGARFYIKIGTATGDTVLAFGDSGGGISMMLPETIDKLKLQSRVKTGLIRGIMPMKYVMFNDVIHDRRIPPPVNMSHLILRRFLQRVSEPFFIIPKEDEELKFMKTAMPFDLFLGQNFFMGKAWTIDYISQQVWINTPLGAGPGIQQIGFKKNAAGKMIFGHPSMVIEVDGAIIEVLFDTGATIVLSEEGKKAFGTDKKTIAGSFIAASVFDKWRKAHPDWKYYPKADMNQDVIEVPSVKIGGYTAGPVLFARRPDEAWSQGMIHSMDKVVKGAIGGSALQYFKVMIDYNASLIKFER